jgi:urease accessory protein
MLAPDYSDMPALRRRPVLTAAHPMATLLRTSGEKDMKAFAMRCVAALGVIGVAVTVAAPAGAHHPMGNQLPGTLLQGLLSGFGHPVIGLDHLAAIVAVGGLAAFQSRGSLSVFGFIAAMLVGTALHVREWTIPGNEMLVALTLVLLGVLLTVARLRGAVGLLVVFVAAGLLHGYALAESIVGAEPAPLASYLAGLAIVQSALGTGVMLTTRRLALQPAGIPLRAGGVAVIVLGAYFLGAGALAG